MTTISPTDPEFYEDRDTAALEDLAATFAENGQHIAASSGADHPLAVEYAAMWAAVTSVLIAREVLA
jgi:hypothetical protein